MVRRLAFLPIGMILCAGLAAGPNGGGAALRLAGAAAGFLGALRPELRQKASIPFESDARKDWHYIPRERPGVLLRDMNDAERRAAHGLLRAALSSRGYLKADAIMLLDQVLRDISIAAGREDRTRDPVLYTFAVYGTPGPDAPWGWKVEGHHISLNFTAVPGERVMVATTPAFLGTAPDEVRAGPHAGLRVLAAERELGRALLLSLDEGQRAKAIVGQEAPGDIVLSPGSNRSLGEPAGLAAADMAPEQRAMLMRLIEEYAGNLAEDLAQERMARVHEGGAEGAIRFAWIGSTEPGQRHYYRVQGAHFVIEYDTVVGDPNHVHTVWRDPEHDFGQDPLKSHYEQNHRRE